MGSTEDAYMLAVIAAAPELATPDDTEVLLDAMPISELASMWGAVQRLSRRDRTGATWSAFLYFDHLPHKRPDRALDLALEVLRSRLFEMELRRQQEEVGSARRMQVGSGERGSKIRTYNFRENRVTDHRIGLTLYNLDRVLAGQLDPLIDALAEADALAVEEAAA